jgi:NAD(P)-dependent dehydrogenase (short-subunit alcohol dehydrogenase family)
VQASHLPDPPRTDSIDGYVASGAFAMPEDIARIGRFLVSPEARWINGAIILADNAVHIRGAG